MAIPALVVGIVVGGIVAAVGQPVVGAVVGVVLVAAIGIWLWRAAPGVVLAAVGARRSDERDRPRLHNLVDGLCATMGLPMPTIYVVPSPVPNAMAVGRDPRSAGLVVTSGLDGALGLVELEGVLAHELVHIKRRDTAVAGAAVAVLRPVAAMTGSGAGIVRALVGAGREFTADQRAVMVVRYPPGLCAALEQMVARPGAAWPPGNRRSAALTRWLWIDPMVGARDQGPAEGNLDDPVVRAAALAEL